MSIIGIIGSADAEQSMVIDSLNDLLDQAAADEEVFYGIIGVSSTSPEAVQYVTEWFATSQAEPLYYELVLETSIAAMAPEGITANSGKTHKSKTVQDKVVSLLLADDDPASKKLLVFAGSDEPSDAEQEAAFKAFEGGAKILDLCDALAEIDMVNEPDAADEPAEDPEPDAPEETYTAEELEAYGASADDDDDEDQDAAVARLTELADANGIDHASINTWAEVVVELVPLIAVEPVKPSKPAATAKKAAPAAKPSAPTKPTKPGAVAAPAEDPEDAPTELTAEQIGALDLKGIRKLGAASGIENAAKMSMAALQAALTKGAPAVVAKNVAIKMGADFGDAEINDAFATLVNGLQRLVMRLVSK